MSIKLTYPITEAAEQLSVSARVVEKLIASGELASFKVGRRRLVAHDDLVDYIARQRRAS